MTYAEEHATNPCRVCGTAPGVVCEHDELPDWMGKRGRELEYSKQRDAEVAAWRAVWGVK